MSKKAIRIETPEEERLRICTRTISGKHTWRPILKATGDWWLEPYIFAVDSDKFWYKCTACKMVDDTETEEKEDLSKMEI